MLETKVRSLGEEGEGEGEEVMTTQCYVRCLEPPCSVEAARYCLVLAGHDEVIRLNSAGQLGLGERCLLPDWDNESFQVRVTVCPLGSVSGPWSYSEDDLTVRCLVTDESGETEELCVELRGLGGLLTLAPCLQVSKPGTN